MAVVSKCCGGLIVWIYSFDVPLPMCSRCRNMCEIDDGKAWKDEKVEEGTQETASKT